MSSLHTCNKAALFRRRPGTCAACEEERKLRELAKRKENLPRAHQPKKEYAPDLS